jgi:hypothetical protein
MMNRKAMMLISVIAALCGCKSTAGQLAAGEKPVGRIFPARCIPMQTKVEFSCWFSPGRAPLTHCVPWRDAEPACGLLTKAGAYLNAGYDNGDRSRSTGHWGIISIYQDAGGRIGPKLIREDGTELLHPEEAATEAPVPPEWPRWPAGREFGPEQVN